VVDAGARVQGVPKDFLACGNGCAGELLVADVVSQRPLGEDRACCVEDRRGGVAVDFDANRMPECLASFIVALLVSRAIGTKTA
jgi:hypothetical protein